MDSDVCHVIINDAEEATYHGNNKVPPWLVKVSSGFHYLFTYCIFIAYKIVPSKVKFPR